MPDQIRPDSRDERERANDDWLDDFRHTCEIGSEAWRQNDIRHRTWRELFGDLKHFYMAAIRRGTIWKLTKGGRGGYRPELTPYFTNTINVYEAFERVVAGTKMSGTARNAVRLRFGTDMTWYQIAGRVNRREDYCRREYKRLLDNVVYNTGVVIFGKERLNSTDSTFTPSGITLLGKQVQHSSTTTNTCS